MKFAGIAKIHEPMLIKRKDRLVYKFYFYIKQTKIIGVCDETYKELIDGMHYEFDIVDLKLNSNNDIYVLVKDMVPVTIKT